MFNRKKQLAELEALRKSYQDLRNDADQLAGKLGGIYQMLAAFGNVADVIAAMERLRNDMMQWNESMGRRVGNCEYQLATVLNKQHLYEQVFRALGADMMLRATGAGSVAPSGPASKGENT